MKAQQIVIKLFSIFCLVMLTACSASKEQVAATMAVQTIQAKASGTAAVEQVVSDSLTKAAPTHTATSTATPMSTHTPTFTATPEVQQYFTEDFDSDLENWDAFREDTKANREGLSPMKAKSTPFYYRLTGNKSVLSFENLQVGDGFLKFDNQKMEINYAIYEPFEYEEVRIDARFENKGSTNQNYVTLICNYTEDVGWYEINISPDGTWYIGYAKASENDIISHDKYYPEGFYPSTSNEIRKGNGVNEFTAICQGGKISLYINGSFETEVDATNIWLDSGKVGVAVKSWDSLPAIINLDWVKISQP